MTRIFQVLSLVAVLFGTAAKADERFMPYLEWLTANSTLEYNGEPLPTVKYLPYAHIEVIYWGDDTVAHYEQIGQQLPRVEAIYDHFNNEFLVPDDVDLFDYGDIVAHELVHFLQLVNGYDFTCPQAHEREAYTLHWKWVEDTGYEAEEPDWLFVYMQALACSEHHSDR